MGATRSNAIPQLQPNPWFCSCFTHLFRPSSLALAEAFLSCLCTLSRRKPSAVVPRAGTPSLRLLKDGGIRDIRAFDFLGVRFINFHEEVPLQNRLSLMSGIRS